MEHKISGPARAGLSIYALDLQRIARFYETVLGMSRVHESPEVVVLQSSDIQLVLHRIPADRAATISLSSPPQRRSSAIKFFFTVPDIAIARSAAQEAGGDVLLEQWQGPGFVVCDSCDPEGNVFHVRESVASLKKNSPTN
ncbi:VOC family protein [Amphibiibacter pelophylacis]|uniref:VOC family protein n=1 Tax=Amphibiibacter pelophylacis TaxID=1799477 RepID=A0ACC6P4N3_9BURK